MIDRAYSVESLFVWIATFSLLTLLAAIVFLPVVFVRMPEDYFTRPPGQESLWSRRHPLLRTSLWLARNLLGGTLVVLGVLMLVLPGQGLLTIAAGLLIATFPGKRGLELAILGRPWIRSSVNRLRSRAGKEPLEFPETAG